MKDDKLTLNDLATAIAEKTQISQKVASKFLTTLFEQIVSGLETDKLVKINGLGTFKLQWNAPRKSIDVNTGETITISAYNKAIFSPEVSIKAKVNEPFAHLEPVEIDEDGQPTNTTESEFPMQKLDEQAEEIKDILSEINDMGETESKENTKPQEKVGKKQVTERKSIVPEMNKKEEKKIVESLPIPPVEKQKVLITTTAKTSKKDIADSAKTTTKQAPKQYPNKGKGWKITGICIGVLIIILIALYFILQNQIEQWAENWLNQTEQVQEVSTEPIAKPIETAISIFDQPRTYTEFIGTDNLTDGSRLAWLSRKYYGAPDFWVYIYEANKDIIADPNHIMIGTKIKIPKVPAELIDPSNPACLEYARKLHNMYVK